MIIKEEATGYEIEICDAIMLGFYSHGMPQFQSYIKLKNPSNLNVRIQRYSYFSDAQNNKIQRKLNAIIGSI